MIVVNGLRRVLEWRPMAVRRRPVVKLKGFVEFNAFFGDLPVFGNLFKNSTRENDKTELLVFITPRVINDKLNVR